jgi:hypothetical protein
MSNFRKLTNTLLLTLMLGLQASTVLAPHLLTRESCYYCSGTGLCQNDYQAGSGKIYNGEGCVVCSGTGKCWHCGGSGKKG